MKLRRADCGHWMIATDKPTGETKHGDPVFLCHDCVMKLEHPAPRQLPPLHASLTKK